MKNKIDIKNWKKFVVEDLFEIINSKAYHKKDIREAEKGERKIAYITRSKFNNGFNTFVKYEDELIINPKNTISFGAENANFFFQPEIYITGNKMYYIDTRKLNPYTSLFIKTIFEKTFSDNYSFSDGMIPERIRNKMIALPVDLKGNPDWNYMEQYMKKIEEHSIRTLNRLNKCNNQNNKINTFGWKEFLIEDLFEIKRPTARSQANYEEGNVPFIASGNYNNGVLKYLTPKKNEILDKGNCITVSPVDGSTFYQKDDFLGRGGAGSSIILLYNPFLNENNGLYLATIIKKVCEKYGYSDMGSKESISKEKIMLPIDENEDPDYDYMSEYIEKIKTIASNKLNILNK